MMKLLHQKLLKGLLMLVLFLTASVSWGQHSTGFEGNFKSSYSAGDATYNGVTWNMSDALVGNLSNDAKAGSWSVRIRNSGNITMQTSVSGGIGTFTLKYAKYNGDSSTSSFKVEYSTNDGGSWTQMGSAVSDVSNTALQTFTATLNISGNVRVRVVKTAGGSNRLNIDDVSWTAGAAQASSSSDIIRNTAFAEPANIDYKLYQATTDITTSNSVEVGSFTLRDGGATTDSDSNGTTLTAISFTVANNANVSRLAIYDGTTEKGDIAVSSGTASFTGLSGLTAADGSTKIFTLRASFKPTVTDNTQLRFTVSSATAATSSSSTFAAANAGAATTSITGDANRIEVTADRLAFIAQPANTLVNASMANVTVSANDANGNRDLDFTGASGNVTLTSTGTLTGTPVSVNAASGLATFTGLTHTAAANGLTLTATRTSGSDWSTDSNAFNITKATQTITFGALANATYGDPSFTLTATGGASGEPITFASLDETVATVTGNIVTIVGPGQTIIAASQAGNDNYNAATDVDQILTINKKELTITDAVAQNKVYDGTENATITGAALSGGIIGSDEVILNTVTAEFDGKNIGTGKDVLAQFAMAGAHASKYVLAEDVLILTADITAKELTITGISIADKNFDSTTGATITGAAEITGIVTGEDVTIGGTPIAVFDNIGPGGNIPVTVTGYEITGADTANYTLIPPTGFAANINDTGLANQTITFGALNPVTYGDASFTLSATASSNLAVAFSSSDENIATVSGTTVTITGAGTVTITALQEGNGTYNPAPAVPQELVVNKKVITVAGAAVTDKIYNGGDVAEVTGTLPGVIAGDLVTLEGTGQFASVDVANGITVETFYDFTGADAGNYELTQPGSLTGNIIPAELTLSGAGANDKIYDGNDAAVITGTLTGVVSGDVVSYTATGTFASAGVNTGIAVTPTAMLEGADAGNYYLTQPTGLTADITVKNLTVTATAQNKPYDGNNTAQIDVTAVNGVIEGDDVTVAGGGTFASAGVANSIQVTAALSLTGDDASNYSLTQPTGLAANITAMNLTVDVTNAVVADKVYDRTTTGAVITGVVITGVAESEEVQVVSGTFTSANADFENNIVTPVLSGAHAGNYTFTQVGTLTGQITPKEVTVTGMTAGNKQYDGTNAATLTGGSLQGVFAADVVAGVALTRSGYFAPVSAEDQGEDVGTGKAIISTSALTGVAAGNYSLTQPTGITANITAKTLTVTGIIANGKVYDGTNAATINHDNAELFGIMNTDDVSLAGTPSAIFANYNVGTRPVTVTGYTLEGDDAGNYSVDPSGSLTAEISPKAISMEGGAVTTKIYDGNTTAQVTGVTLTGVEEGDTVNAVTGTYALPSVGTHYVTVALSGPNAANYTLTQSDPLLSGSITKKNLTVTADNKTINKGAGMPAFTVSFNGFVPGDNSSDIAEVPTASVTVANTNTAGAYPVTVSGGEADNYELVLVNGWFIIQDVQQGNVSANPLSIWSNAIAGNSDDNPYTAGQIYNANYIGVPTGLGATGISLTTYTASSGRYGGSGWWTSSSINTGKYFSFRLAPLSAYQIDFVSLTGTWQRSNTGPKKYEVRSSIDNFATTIASGTLPGNDSAAAFNLDLSSLQNVTSSTTNNIAGVELRLYGFDASSAGGSLTLNDFAITAHITQNSAIPGTGPTISNLLANNTTTYTMAYGAANASFDVNATGSPEITFSAAFPAGVDGKAEINTATGVITFDGDIIPGTYNIPVTARNYYNQTGNTRTLRLVVNKINQQVTFTTDPTPLPANLNPGDTFTIAYTNAAGLPVDVSSSNTDVATTATDDNGITTVTIVAAGSANIVVSNTGDDIYNAYNGTVTALTIRSLTVTPNPIASFHAYQGQGASAPVQFTSISGTGLSQDQGNISYTVSGPFEIALGIAAYSQTGSFPYTATSGSLNIANPQITVRLQNGQAIGNYTGTVTFTGGGATTVVDLSAIVEAAPSINVTSATYGAYCAGTQNNISVAFTTEGIFPAGSFRVQLSNASGVFPNNFSNTISLDASASPISATLPNTMAAGNYRVRVIHISEDLAMTASTNNNGSDIQIKALPTLTGVQSAPVCAGNDMTVTLSGLIANTEVTAGYTLGSMSGNATVTADASGYASFEVPVTDGNNGQTITISDLVRTDAGNCATTFSTNNSAIITVYPAPTATGISAVAACNGTSANILVEGLIAESASEVSYTVDGGTANTIQLTADTNGEASFELALATGTYDIAIISVTNTVTGCTSEISGITAQIVVSERPTAAITSEGSSLCLGAQAEIAVALTGEGPWELIYSDGSTQHEVIIEAADLTGSIYTLAVTPAEGATTYTLTGLTDANCEAIAADLSGSITLNAAANLWEGDVDNDWFNAGNWSCGVVPTATIAASITNGTTKIAGGQTANAEHLTISGTGHLIVETGSSLFVTNAVTVVNDIDEEGVITGGQLTIQNNANLIQNNNGANINSGLVTVEKNSAPMWRLDYAMWAAPVAGETLIGFSPETLANRFYRYNPLTDGYTTNGMNEGNVAFEKGRSYLIRASNIHPSFESNPTAPTAWEGAYVGIPNNGDVSVSVVARQSEPGQPGYVSGFNAIGNPYPSPINVYEFYTRNSNNLVNGSSIFFWRKKNNADTSSYVSLTLGGLIVNNDNPWGDSSNGEFDNLNENDEWVINAGQGFIVQARTNSIVFDNDMRQGVHHDYQFRSAQDQTSTASRLWLNLKNDAGQFSQSLIAYTDNTTLDIDFGWDGKVMSDGAISLYSFAGETRLGIQARMAFDDADEVPMGYKAEAAGSYTLSIDHVDGIFAEGQEIFLRDNLTGITHSLTDGAYTFTTEAGTFAGRFDVLYAEALDTDIPVADPNSIIVYKNGNNINITSGAATITGVTVHDLRGRLLYSNNNVNSAETVVSGLQAQEQMLIVEVATEKGKVSKKIIF